MTSRRSNSFLSQKLRSIIQGTTFDLPMPPAEPDPLTGIPFADHRYNHRYPLLLHKDARRIQVRTTEDLAACLDPQARLTSGSPVVQTAPYRVSRGLDFLKVSFWIEWNPQIASFLGILDFMKKQVQETEKDCIPVFKENGFDWNLYRTGTAKYSFRLRSGDITLMFNKRKSDGQIPNCRLEIGSLSCWSPGFYSIYERVKSFLAGYGAKVIKERVSEVHLAADFIGTDIKAVDLCNQDKWIIKAQSFNPHDKIPLYHEDQEPEPEDLDFNPHYTHRKFTGVDMGKGDMMLRVYDKVTELKRSRATHKQQIFSEIWGFKQFDEQAVTRVEYQVRRPKLREFAISEEERIDTVSDLVKALRSLWGYLTTEWTRHTENPVNRNHNQSKSKVSEFWQKVQAVVWSGMFGYVRTHPVKHRDVVQLRRQARGCLMSVCASLEVEPDDIDKIVYLCKDLIEEDLHQLFEDEQAFKERMITKRNEFRATLAG
ncbi:hypothetical protein [uncultured Desulfobulbus sp.]|uniref:hypothetical protein n=1 Tax=uncultured Desulfobulbus sp. TaxID=239745 RepID=UPI0029C713CD|nr:hypothetical protein [uncultured Desulfobulbus sp.]